MTLNELNERVEFLEGKYKESVKIFGEMLKLLQNHEKAIVQMNKNTDLFKDTFEKILQLIEQLQKWQEDHTRRYKIE